MPIIPIRDMNEYKRQKIALQNRFESERSGDQSLFTEQSKVLQPLITVQKETMKTLQDNIVASQDNTSAALVPFTQELKRRNDQVDMLAEQPFYRKQNIPAIAQQIDTSSPAIAQQFARQYAPQTATSTPAKNEGLRIDLDQELNTTDRENLEDLGMDLPSAVFKKESYDDVFKQIKSENKSIGQYLGKGKAGQNLKEGERKVYESRRDTLKKYKEILQDSEGGKRFISTKLGSGLRKNRRQRKHVDIIPYPYTNVDELFEKLQIHAAAKSAGNTGLDNHINSILDELLRVKAIKKNEYDELYKEIFKK